MGSEIIANVTSKAKNWIKKQWIAEHNESDDYFIVGTSEVLKGSKENVLSRDFAEGADLREEFISDITQECQQKSGTLIDLKTNVGILKTCKVEVSDVDAIMIAWYAQDIPFGIVQLSYKDLHNSSEDFEYKIKSFKK